MLNEIFFLLFIDLFTLNTIPTGLFENFVRLGTSFSWQSQPGRFCKLKRNNPDCDSAIEQHLLDNEQCAANYNDKYFIILAVACNSFDLCLLKATFIIRIKTRQPVLCKQKEFVLTLKLFK